MTYSKYKIGMIFNNFEIVSDPFRYKDNTLFLAKCLNCNSITNKTTYTIRYNGCNTCNHHRIYSFNYHQFENLDSIDKIYWLGFIYGDGSIVKNSLRIELSNKDKDHLDKFCNFMNYNGIIYPTKKECSVLSMNSALLVRDLASYNIKPRKSYSNLYPSIEEKYKSHFYRGILDSDGWIIYHKSSKQYEFGFSSNTKQILVDIQDYFSRLLEKKCGALNHRVKENQSCYQLIIGGNTNFRKIANILYKDANYYLTRKYTLVQNALLDLDSR